MRPCQIHFYRLLRHGSARFKQCALHRKRGGLQRRRLQPAQGKGREEPFRSVRNIEKRQRQMRGLSAKGISGYVDKTLKTRTPKQKRLSQGQSERLNLGFCLSASPRTTVHHVFRIALSESSHSTVLVILATLEPCRPQRPTADIATGSYNQRSALLLPHKLPVDRKQEFEDAALAVLRSSTWSAPCGMALAEGSEYCNVHSK